MNTLKEQNGRYYQEVEVVMLSTEYSRITLYDYDNLKTLSLTQGNHKGNKDILPQRFYFLSDDEIKEGDWVMDATNQIRKVLNIVDKRLSLEGIDFLTILPQSCKKIIATTDESLRISYKENNHQPLSSNNYTLPRPSDSFIKKYIEEYNAGRQITKVLVEYEPYHSKIKSIDIKYKLKVDSNNTITTTKVKDSYSREEHIEGMWQAYKAANSIFSDDVALRAEFDNWIKENL